MGAKMYSFEAIRPKVQNTPSSNIEEYRSYYKKYQYKSNNSNKFSNLPIQEKLKMEGRKFLTQGEIQ
jgi:hypothetical protein